MREGKVEGQEEEEGDDERELDEEGSLFFIVPRLFIYLLTSSSIYLFSS